MTESSSSAPGWGRRWIRPWVRRWVRRLVWALVLVELAWLAAGNAFLRTSWGPSLLERRPEKLQVAWESAWTPLPGVVRAHRLDVRGRTPKVTWMASADGAWLWIAPLDLLRRRFHVRYLDADGLESRVRLEGKDPEGQPIVDGFEGLERPERKEKEHRWRIDFDRVSVDGIRELWFGPLHYVSRPDGGRADSADDGPYTGSATGKLRSQVRGEVEVPWAQVELGPGRVVAGSEALGTLETFQADGRLHPFVPRQAKGIETLGYVSGIFEASTTGGSLGLVDYFFRGAPASVHGTGRLRTTLHLDRGVLQSGSSLAVENGSVEVSYLGWRGEGDGHLTGEVSDGGETTLTVQLDEADLGLRKVSEKLVVSRDARLVATAERFDLSERRPGLRVEADLPDSEVSDLAQLQAFLPAHAKVEILGGRGTLRAHGRLTVPGTESSDTDAGKSDPGKSDAGKSDSGSRPTDLVGTVQGTVHVDGEAVDVRIQGREITADLDLLVEMPRGDLATRVLELQGSRLQLRDVRLRGVNEASEPLWWADLRVAEGRVQLPRDGTVVEGAVDAQLEAELADSRPILALVVERRRSFRWFERLLTFQNLDVSARLRTRDDGVEFRDLRVHDRADDGADKALQILGQLRFDESGYDALLRASMKAPVGHVAAGLRVRGGEIADIDLRHSLEWYRRQSETFWP